MVIFIKILVLLKLTSRLEMSSVEAWEDSGHHCLQLGNLSSEIRSEHSIEQQLQELSTKTIVAVNPEIALRPANELRSA